MVIMKTHGGMAVPNKEIKLKRKHSATNSTPSSSFPKEEDDEDVDLLGGVTNVDEDSSDDESESDVESGNESDASQNVEDEESEELSFEEDESSDEVEDQEEDETSDDGKEEGDKEESDLSDSERARHVKGINSPSDVTSTERKSKIKHEKSVDQKIKSVISRNASRIGKSDEDEYKSDTSDEEE